MSTRWNTGIMRSLIVAGAVGLFFVAAPATRADDDSDIDIDTADSSTILNSGEDPGVLETTIDDKSKCKDAGGCVTVKGSVKNDTPTAIYALVEYNTKTCAFISSGTWKSVEAPKEGKLSQTTEKGHLKSGKCKTKEYEFGVLVYTADAKKTPAKDKFEAEWTTPDFPKTCPKCQIGVTGDVKIEAK